MRGLGPTVVGLLLIGALILLVTPTRSPRLAPVGAVGGAGLGGYAAPQSSIEPIAPPAALPSAPEAAPLGPRPFTPAPPGTRSYVPIMMYHYVRYVDAGADPLGYGLSVTPEQLGAQLDWLGASGYETVRMDQLAACMSAAGACPARAVALTFDDGYMDAFTAALPLLQQHGAVATFYIVSGFVGQPGYMGWNEIRALRDAGMEIGAHSVTHPDLTTLAPADAQAQIAQSGATIAAELGGPVRSFCYPAGRFNETVVALAREAGYSSATTTVPDGPQNDPLALPRLRISGELSQASFQWMVAAYLP